MPTTPARSTTLRPSVFVVASLLAATVGCSAYAPDWPVERAKTVSDDQGRLVRSYTLGATNHPNYTQRLRDGRVVELAFDDDGDGQANETVDLSTPQPDWPHFLIILDGVPYSAVRTMYQEGHFRLFPPPTPVASVFPAMTDVALTAMWHVGPCVASEAQYFDRAAKRLTDGNAVYLKGENAPWTREVTWVAPQNIAIRTYLQPWTAFRYELREMDRLFSATTLPFASAYSVGSAGIGTREGEAGIRAYLAQVDRLCERVTFDRRGRVRFSITADHGHTLQPCRRITFKQVLEDAGFRIRKSIADPRDVVVVSYGLATSAQLYTDRTAEVAAAVLKHPDVDLVMYRSGDRVLICSSSGTAYVSRLGDGYDYEAADGDPLELLPLIRTLRQSGQVAANGKIDDRALLEATITHTYPDPLHRVWGYFEGTVQNPAEVVVSLKPHACHGSAFFYFFVQAVASTHGGLDREGSVTFLLSNAVAGSLPPVLRIEDVLSAIGGLPGAPTLTDR